MQANIIAWAPAQNGRTPMTGRSSQRRPIRTSSLAPCKNEGLAPADFPPSLDAARRLRALAGLRGVILRPMPEQVGGYAEVLNISVEKLCMQGPTCRGGSASRGSSGRFGGGGGIRTHGTLAGTAVFKTAALNHSATPPGEGRKQKDEGRSEAFGPPGGESNARHLR